ncbi:SDR family NAD(P)-dependent oxidoreductase [bacterium]|nr:SDR family NAD(P)-dependent oxidoreductase [bacterium]
MQSQQSSSFDTKTVLITGSNSGLGFEAARQFAAAGYGRVILACRTLEKANSARKELVALTGLDPFETLAVDVSSIDSAHKACEELISRGHQIDSLLLNAGLVSGDRVNKSEDGFELSFAASVIGHHIMTVRLAEANMLASGARVVIAGSEAARDDLPAMMGFKLYDFGKGQPAEFGSDLTEAMKSFASVSKPQLYDGNRYYAMTKLMTSWWAAAASRHFSGKVSVFAVSPGSNMDTAAGRNLTGVKKFLFTVIMPKIAPFMGMSQPTHLGAKRYLDVLLGEGGPYVSGKTYTSKEKKLVGPMFEQKHPHLVDVAKQDATWATVVQMTNRELFSTEKS